ncbi:hypothetical protein M9Y10_001989 [Tritrichomonas musculus]|uniref:Uncharacterized protein n=1 Tax=Tritrichomonas musculus TaxID=1915356 RepID=A0ABR2L8X0_9EUKA
MYDGNNIYSDLKSKAQTLLKSTVNIGFSSPSQNHETVSPKSTVILSEQDKLKELIKKHFADKTQLKNELDKEIAAHKEDVSKLTNDLSNLKSSFSNLAENIASKPAEASPEQIEKVDHLKISISNIQNEIRKANNEISELQINNEVLKKQSIQYKVRIKQLQEDIQISDKYRQELNRVKTQISKSEDEILNKTREIKQHEQASQWNKHETQKFNQELNQLLNRRLNLTFHNSDPMYIYQPVYNFKTSCLKIYNEMNSENQINSNESNEIKGMHKYDLSDTDFNENININQNCSLPLYDENDDSILSDFILSIPLKIKSLESENQQLMQQSAKYRRQISKLQHLESKAIAEEAKLKAKKEQMTTEKPLPSPEKLKKAIQKLTEMNKEKDDAIAKLESIIVRQQKGMEKVTVSPSTNTALALSMRRIFGKLRTCSRSEKKDLCEQGKAILDAMLGIKH